MNVEVEAIANAWNPIIKITDRQNILLEDINDFIIHYKTTITDLTNEINSINDDDHNFTWVNYVHYRELKSRRRLCRSALKKEERDFNNLFTYILKQKLTDNPAIIIKSFLNGY